MYFSRYMAVLVAIAIPVFTTQLEKSRETTDMANLRSAYGAATVYGMTTSLGPATVIKYYNPGVDGAIVDDAPTISIGQGTAADGKADTKQVSGQIEYTTGTDAKGKDIAIEYSNGIVQKVSFK